MVTVRDPVLKPVAVDELRPTQITVGMREVQERRAHWRSLKGKKLEFLETHMIPVVLGPKDRHYVIDHHHLARALHDEGVKKSLSQSLRICRSSIRTHSGSFSTTATGCIPSTPGASGAIMRTFQNR